jgi:hypothetical protein
MDDARSPNCAGLGWFSTGRPPDFHMVEVDRAQTIVLCSNTVSFFNAQVRDQIMSHAYEYTERFMEIAAHCPTSPQDSSVGGLYETTAGTP